MMRVKKLLGILIAFLTVYVIQFLIVPNLFPTYFPRSNEAFIIFFVTLIGIVSAGMFFISSRMIYWIAGDILYLFLIWIYPANGAYGIGMQGITLDGTQAGFSREDIWFSILFMAFFIVAIEIIAKLMLTLVNMVRCKINK